MGSFDAVCGLSNMAIGYGQPVVAMVIRQNPWATYTKSPIYPFDIWQPASVLIRGEYGDYGNVSLDDAAVADWKLTQKAAQQWWKKVWVEPSTTAQGLVMKGRWSMQQDRLDYTFDESGERPEYDREEDNPKVFSLWMAHAGIFDHLVNTVEAEWYNNGAFSAHGKTARFIADHSVGNAREIMEGEVPKDYEEMFAYMSEAYKDHNRIADLKNALRYTRNPWKSGSSQSTDPVSEYFESAIYDAHDAQDKELYERLIGHFHTSQMLNTILYQMRRSVTPPGSIGPQHGHDQPFLALAEAIRVQAEKNKSKYGDEFDDDDDEVEIS